ncbi:RidA family protein [Streptomyces sp. AHA2]|uniref:RidA family protein n=1 Tax=Streptomyces sp. AHA2 TaxID=3064526 RepID=UPI002FE1624D
MAGRFGAGPGGTVVSDDFGRQVKRAFHNLAVALAAHGLGLEDVVQLRTYVVNHDVGRLGPITEAVREGWGTRPPARTLVGVAGGRPPPTCCSRWGPSPSGADPRARIGPGLADAGGRAIGRCEEPGDVRTRGASRRGGCRGPGAGSPMLPG